MSKGIILSNSSLSSALTQNPSQFLSTTSTLHWLFESLGWRDISQEVGAKQLEEFKTKQILIAAVQTYEESPTEENNQKVAAIITKEIIRIEGARDYALNMTRQLQKQLRKEQREAEKAAAEFKPASNYWESLQQISSHFSESITTRLKTFCGLTTAQQVEKYRELAQNREKELAVLRSYRRQLQSKLVASASTDNDSLQEIMVTPRRRLLQTTMPAEMSITYCEPVGTCPLAELSDGQAGFLLSQQDLSAFFGSAVSSAGDINGDGIDDFLVGASVAAKVTVVFGSNQSSVWSAGTLDSSTIADGKHGFVLIGQAGDQTGKYVGRVGDVNGDGLDDILVGSPGAGKTTVVFGSNQTGAWGSGTLNLTTSADGIHGFVLTGQTSCVSSAAGDINGDGLGDILIGLSATVNGAGATTVVFGSKQPTAWSAGTVSLASLANGQRGFALIGQVGDYSAGGAVSSAGDINGDQLDDILVGAPGAFMSWGKTTVIFGSNQTGAWGSGVMNLTAFADGKRGFVLLGQADDNNVQTVSGVGDINGDGLDDILIAAPYSFAQSGRIRVVFGSNQPGAWGSGTLNLTTLTDGQRGFMLQGEAADYSGYSACGAGDINGDHLDDILVGAPGLAGSAGKTTVVFGSNQPGAWGSGTLNLASLADGQRGFLLLGRVVDWNGWSVSSAGDINGDGLDDFLVGATKAGLSGQVTVVFGDGAYQVTNNQLRIAVGETVPLNLNLLSAVSSIHNNATLKLTPEMVQHGRFEAVGVPGVTLSSFLSGNISSVQFQQDNSALAPSYQITMRHTALLYAYSIAQVDFLGYPPVLVNNEVYVNQGLSTLVTSSDLSASDVDTPAASLRFVFSNVQHAQFNLVNNNGSILAANISSCLQQAVFDQQLQLIPDGLVMAPGYRIAVTDGFSTTSSRAAVVTFNHAPLITVNSLILDQGQATAIRPQDISASDDQTLSDALSFQVTNVTFGDYFEYSSNRGYVLTAFNQVQLAIGNVAFVQNGSKLPPAFSIRVTDGQITTPWHAAIIYFNHRPVLQRTLPTYLVDEGSAFSIDLDDNLFTDPDGDPLTLRAQQLGGAPLPNKITFDDVHTSIKGIIETLVSLQIEVIASDPRGLTASANFTLQSVSPKSAFNFQSLTSVFSALGSAALTVLGYMWWRRNAANHRVGYEFANALRRVLNLEYFDFTKDKGELYKTYIERLLNHFVYIHNDFYAALTSKEERHSFVVCVAEIIQNKDLLHKASCFWATHNRFFLFNRSWPKSLDLNKFGKETTQIAQEAVTVWREESQRTGGDPLTRWPYPTSGIRESKATRKETSGGSVELKALVIDQSFSSFRGNRNTTFASSPLSVSNQQNFREEPGEGATLPI